MSAPHPQYSNNLCNNLWKDIANGFLCYGMISPDADTNAIPDLKQANEDMVKYVISQLNIGSDSHVLDLASGRGMYTVSIAQQTGCRYVGTDINEIYLQESRKLAEKHGVSERGKFIYSTWEKMSEKVKENKYTHIVSFSAMIYGHGVLDTIFKDIADCCDTNTKVLICDTIRKVDWKDCAEVNKHLKVTHPIASMEEMVEKIENSRLKLSAYEDFTQFTIPGYKVLTRECRKRDPELSTLTYNLVGQAFEDETLAYVIFHLRLRSK